MFGWLRRSNMKDMDDRDRQPFDPDIDTEFAEEMPTKGSRTRTSKATGSAASGRSTGKAGTGKSENSSAKRASSKTKAAGTSKTAAGTAKTTTRTSRTASGTSKTTGKTSGARSKKVSIDTVSVGDGVFVDPTPITPGQEVMVKYNGLLSKSGADKIYIHTGFGTREWNDIRDLPMTKSPDGAWTTTIKIDPDESSRFNFCFRDSAFNWDNNSGNNWSFEIHNGKRM